MTAFFGAHTTCTAAITAAIYPGPDFHPDRDRRRVVWLACAGALGGPRPTKSDWSTACRRLGCPTVVLALVALALLFPLMGAVTGAFAVPEQRFAATLTLVVTASGVAAFGIGAAFWGLIEKLQVQAPKRLRRQAVA